MARPLKKRRGDVPPKSLNIKKPALLRAIHDGALRAGLGYTAFLERRLAAAGEEADAAGRPARLRAILDESWKRLDRVRAAAKSRGAPPPSSDHADLYDEHGLPK